MKFALLVSDLGGLNVGDPVLQDLRLLGHAVTLYASGKSAERLQEKGRDFVRVGEVNEFLVNDMRGFDVVLCTMNAGPQNEDPSLLVANTLMGSSTPTFALQDYWGSCLKTSWRNTRPTMIAVNDDVAKRIVQETWTDMKDDRIVVAGYPNYDKYAGYDLEGAQSKLRALYSIPDDGKQIWSWGGAANCTGRPVLEFVRGVRELGLDVHLILRPHPRGINQFPYQQPYYAAARVLAGEMYHPSPEKGDDPDLVSAGSDLVATTFSSTAIEASLLRRPNISILYKDDGMKEFGVALGGVCKEFPLVELKCTAKCGSYAALLGALKRAYRRQMNFEKFQKQAFPTDGKNTKRVVEAILALASRS